MTGCATRCIDDPHPGSLTAEYLLPTLESFPLHNPFIPTCLLGRQSELEQIRQLLQADGDLMVAGVSGSGRRSLIRWAAQQVGARVIELDCLRATHTSRFLELLAEGLLEVFTANAELDFIQQWGTAHDLVLQQDELGRSRLRWTVPQREEWVVLKVLLALPQLLAERLQCRIVFVFQHFPHIRSWDRTGNWETYLRQEIQRQTLVNYVVVATVPEEWAADSHLQVMTLAPLAPEALTEWLVGTMAQEGLVLTPEALALFFQIVRGHVGDAIALARRIWLEYRGGDKPLVIQPPQVQASAIALVDDLAVTFESLLLLLPPIQARVLESLALDPTHSPQSREYIRKHQLSRGGSLQGALVSLEQKGLVYGADYGYQIALPLLAFWLNHRIA